SLLAVCRQRIDKFDLLRLDRVAREQTDASQRELHTRVVRLKAEADEIAVGSERKLISRKVTGAADHLCHSAANVCRGKILLRRPIYTLVEFLAYLESKLGDVTSRGCRN